MFLSRPFQTGWVLRRFERGCVSHVWVCWETTAPPPRPPSPGTVGEGGGLGAETGRGTTRTISQYSFTKILESIRNQSTAPTYSDMPPRCHECSKSIATVPKPTPTMPKIGVAWVSLLPLSPIQNSTVNGGTRERKSATSVISGDGINRLPWDP
jgi:hypothetical protein